MLKDPARGTHPLNQRPSLHLMEPLQIRSTNTETHLYKERAIINFKVFTLAVKVRKLQGTVLDVEKTNDSFVGDEGNKWEKCIFTLELTNFSKRTPNEVMPENLKGKKVKLVRYCCFDWHYKLGVRKTLEPDETEAVLGGKPTKTVYW